MQSRQILDSLGLSKKDLIDLSTQTMADWSLDDLQYLMLHIEMEINYREDMGLLDE